MDEFKKEILELEHISSMDSFIFEEKDSRVLISAPHTIFQHKESGEEKLNEPFTKAICMYIANHVNCSYIVKTKDNYKDPNNSEIDSYKNKMLSIINKKDVKLVIDIHGADKDREFDIELGTLNNLSADYSTIKELYESFIEHNIKSVSLNEPFKGGKITQMVYGWTDADVIQIEINRCIRDISNIEDLYNVCNAIIDFINQYLNK